jgi:rhodanese-related sulfurtransferase
VEAVGIVTDHEEQLQAALGRLADAGAGEVLEEAGLKEVYNVSHGFEGDLDDSHHRNSHNGWQFEGLPWAQT